jgi:AraC-like DNA-binding protein
MIVLPVPVFTALLLLYLFLLARLRGQGGIWLQALVLAAAVQSAVLAGALHYGLPGLRWVMPAGASLLPPLAWAAFAFSSVRAPQPRDLLHGLGPAAVLACLATARPLLDAVLPLLFAGYGAALLLALRGGRDVLAGARLGDGGLPLLLWRMLAAALIAAAASDVLILVDFWLQGGRHALLIASSINPVCLLVLGALPLARELDPPPPEAPAAAKDPAADADLMARLEELMRRRCLYLDADLTLLRMARLLGVPAKTLSAAVNRATGSNVSRYVNGWRVARAAELLSRGAPVTEAMLESGFATKSNFNREFLRIQGCTPSQWRAQAAGAPAAP